MRVSFSETLWNRLLLFAVLRFYDDSITPQLCLKYLNGTVQADKDPYLSSDKSVKSFNIILKHDACHYCTCHFYKSLSEMSFEVSNSL